MATVAEALALALQHHRAGRLPEAERIYRLVLEAEPANAEALHALGLLAYQAGRYDLSVVYIQQAVGLSPRAASYHSNLGLAYQALGRLVEAEACYRQALRLRPDFPEVQSNLGAVLQEQQRSLEAEACYREALRLRPGYAEAYNNLGNTLRHQARLPEAEACFREALRLQPEIAAAHYNLGNALGEQEKLDEAEAHCREALRLQPDYPEAQANLGSILHEQGRLDEAAACYREALRLKPNDALAHQGILSCMSFMPAVSPAALLAEHRAWAARHAPGPAVRAVHVNDRTPNRRLRVGYVSPDLRRHPVAFFIEPVLAHHDPEQVEVFCYAEVLRPDPITDRLRSLVPHWRLTCGLTDERLAGQIRADGIDLLVDLAGHTVGNRLPVFGHQPAPVQVTYLGYPNTTGLEAIDYRLTDPLADPLGEPDWHAEELWRLAGCFCCYAPPADAPGVAASPAFRTGHITFGSLHRLCKLNACVLDLWCRLLRALPSARLLVCYHTLLGKTVERLRREFTDRGVAEERLDLRQEVTGGRGGHLAAYGEVDVLLDTFPWGGHATACEALWMGVPVLTLCGSRHAGRMVSSVLTCLGLTEWIARTPEEFVKRGLEIAGDPGRLVALRSGLRERLKASPLCDGAAFTRRLEEAYRQMWQRWCAPR